MQTPPNERIDLTDYGISVERGFLPIQDPIGDLPDELRTITQIARDLPDLLAAQQVARALRNLPIYELSRLPALHEAAFRDYAFITAAYIWEHWLNDVAHTHIPANLAVPLCSLAHSLGRLPTLGYTSYALYNWQRFSTHDPLVWENLRLIRKFYGGLDETGFIIPHVIIECQAGRAIVAVIRAQEAAIQGDATECAAQLSVAVEALAEVNKTMSELPLRCDPHTYNIRVRPFIFWSNGHPLVGDGFVYEGVEQYGGTPQKFRGETGAQSSLFPLLDAALGISHDSTSPLSVHLLEMRQYMQMRHRELIATIERRKPIRVFAADDSGVAPMYNEIIKAMTQFRATHFTFANEYIFRQPKARGSVVDSNKTGTGGTDFKRSLWKHVGDTQGAKL